MLKTRIHLKGYLRIVMCVFICFLVTVIRTIHNINLFKILEDFYFLIAALLICLSYKNTRSGLVMKNVFIYPSVIIPFFLSTIVVMCGVITGANVNLMSYGNLSIVWFLSIYIGYSVPVDDDLNIINRILTLIVFFLFLNACYSFIEYVSRYNVFLPFMTTKRGVNRYVGSSEYRVGAMFVNPIPYGTILIFAFWLSKYLFRDKIIERIFNAVFIVSLILTRSRSSWLAFAFTIVIYILSYLYQNKKLSKKVLIYILFGCICLVLLWVISPNVRELVNIIYSRFSIVSGSTSAIQRLGAIDYVLKDMHNNSSVLNILFGHGHGASGALMAGTKIVLDDFSTTDNQFITVLYDYGFLTFMVLLFFIIELCWQSFMTKDRFIQCINLSLIGFWISSFFYEVLPWTNICFVAFLLTGIRLSYNQRKHGISI